MAQRADSVGGLLGGPWPGGGCLGGPVGPGDGGGGGSGRLLAALWALLGTGARAAPGRGPGGTRRASRAVQRGRRAGARPRGAGPSCRPSPDAPRDQQPRRVDTPVRATYRAPTKPATPRKRLEGTATPSPHPRNHQPSAHRLLRQQHQTPARADPPGPAPTRNLLNQPAKPQPRAVRAVAAGGTRVRRGAADRGGPHAGRSGAGRAGGRTERPRRRIPHQVCGPRQLTTLSRCCVTFRPSPTSPSRPAPDAPEAPPCPPPRPRSTAAGVPVYFCHPASPWQRGSNENTDCPLRQYFPKGTDLSRHTREELDEVAAELNSRPRKTLGWETPAERLATLLAA